MSKPKLAVGISYFNSVKEIPRLLDPIVKHVDMIIGIDGKYPLFEWPDNYSTDGSTELLIQGYNAIVARNKEPIEQIEKRNQYLQIAEKEGMDWVLVLDTDDYLHPAPINQRWDMFFDQLSKIPDDQLLANIWFYISVNWVKNWNVVPTNRWQRYTRLMRPERIRYHTTHWQYIDKDLKDEKGDPITFEMPPLKAVDGCRFTADSTLREKKYIDAGYQWAEKQMEQENDRYMTPLFKRMRLNYWIRDFKRIATMPNVKIKIDNSEGKIATKLMDQNKSTSSTS